VNKKIEPLEYITIGDEIYAKVNPKYLKWQGEQLYEIRLKNSNIPIEYQKWTWEDYLGEKSRKEVDQLKKYSEKVKSEFKQLRIQHDSELKYTEEGKNIFNEVKVIYVFGHEKRVQKTTVACILGKELIKEGFIVKYIKFHRLINALLKTTGYSNNEEFENEIKNLIRSDYIILDESFSKSSSILFKSYEANLEIISKLDYFIRDYLDNGGKFIITSNESFDTLGDIYGERIYKMLEENMIEFEMKDVVSENKKSKLSKELLFG